MTDTNKPWLATFTRGYSYALRDGDGTIVFAVGVPTPVSDEVKEYLEQTATETRLTSSDHDEEREVTVRSMFNFAPNPNYVEPSDAVAVA